MLAFFRPFWISCWGLCHICSNVRVPWLSTNFLGFFASLNSLQGPLSAILDKLFGIVILGKMSGPQPAWTFRISDCLIFRHLGLSVRRVSHFGSAVIICRADRYLGSAVKGPRKKGTKNCWFLGKGTCTIQEGERLCQCTGKSITHKYLPEAGIVKKLSRSLAGLAKQSRLRYSWLRFGLPQPAIMDSESKRCTQPANSQLIPQCMMKYLGLVRLAQLSGLSWLNFLTKTPAAGYLTRQSICPIRGLAV